MRKKIEVGKKVLATNEQYAEANSRLLSMRKQLCLNLISSPGSGKTTILQETIKHLRDKFRIGVIEGDIQTSIDAERIAETKAPAIQINTEGACHLSALQVSSALEQLPVDELEIIFIENVGNLVCPSVFELGENAKVVVLSVPEGDDKCAKYPGIFARSKVLLINKMDLLEKARMDFDIERVQRDAKRVNKKIKIMAVSAKTGIGMQDWYGWLEEQLGYVKSK